MKTSHLHKGQGAIEFLVIFLSFAGLFLGLLEMTRLFRAKHLLALATFSAARIGAMHNAKSGPMNAELANGMVPLFMEGGTSLESLRAAKENTYIMVNVPGIGVRVLSPTRSAFSELSTWQRIRREEDVAHWLQKVLPNDNLQSRPRAVFRGDARAHPEHINVQDANILQVTSIWCVRLITPILDRAIFALVNQPVFINNRQLACNAVSLGALQGVPYGFYLPITADALVRMQSVVVEDALAYLETIVDPVSVKPERFVVNTHGSIGLFGEAFLGDYSLVRAGRTSTELVN